MLPGISASDILDQPANQKNDPVPMYPVSAKLITRNLTLLTGRNANEAPQTTYTFDLWTDKEPSNYNSRFNQLDL